MQNSQTRLFLKCLFTVKLEEICRVLSVTYIRRPLFRTHKGPEILLEIANVRNNRKYKNCTNWLNKHEKSI